MGDMDQGIKRLLQTYPADLLHLALPDAMLPALEAAGSAQLRDVLAHVGVETLEQLRARLEQKP